MTAPLFLFFLIAIFCSGIYECRKCYFDAIWDKYALHLVQISAGIEPFNGAFRDEFSEQHQHQNIK